MTVFGNQTWELVQAFGEAMKNQELWNQRYLLPIIILFLLAIVGVLIYWGITNKAEQKKNKKKYTNWW